jgi:hypothetical protein
VQLIYLRGIPKEAFFTVLQSYSVSELYDSQFSASNTSSPRKSSRKNPDAGSVALKEVMTVLNNVYGTSQSLVADCDESFPLQQKVLVSTLLLILKKGHNKNITVGKVQ